MLPPIAWPFDWTVYAGLLIFSIDYAVIARARGLRPRNALWFALGVLTLWIALETPIDTISDRYLMSVHMVQHVLLLFVAPPLLLLGLSPPMARAVVNVPGVRWLTRPWTAQIIAAAIMIGWHLPAAYDLTLQNEGIHILEHITFIAAGVIFWWPVLRATSATSGQQLSDGWKIAYLFVGTLPQDAVALPLIFSRVSFYGFYDHVPRLADWLTPTVDQTVAGSVMMLAAKITILIALVTIFFRWVSSEHGPALTGARTLDSRPTH